MDAFGEMVPSVTVTFVSALTKMSPSQEAMDNRLNENIEKLNYETLPERIISEKSNTKVSQRVFFFSGHRGQIILFLKKK